MGGSLRQVMIYKWTIGWWGPQEWGGLGQGWWGKCQGAYGAGAREPRHISTGWSIFPRCRAIWS